MVKCVVKSLTEVLRLKTEALYHHSIEVGHIAESLCRGIQYPDDRLKYMKYAGYLHDLGKIAVKDAILQKPGDLSRREWEQIKLHPIMSISVLKNVEDFPGFLLKAVLYHHENADGTGYFGLKDSEIPLEAKILRIADVFSAMSMDRPYKAAIPAETVASYCSGLFDLGVSRTFVRNTLLDSKKAFKHCYKEEVEDGEAYTWPQ